MNNYEAMFLLDNKEAKRDWEGLEAHVQGILKKHGAEVVLVGKWDERKLAYEIGPHKRSTYYLTYFKAPAEAITPMCRDFALSEHVVRQIILTVETIPSEIKKAEAMVEVPEVGGSSMGPSFDSDGGDRRPRFSRTPEPVYGGGPPAVDEVPS